MSLAAVAQPVFYVGNGSQTVFAYPFKILDKKDLAVKVTANGVCTDQTVDVHYTVTGIGADTGGNVTFFAQFTPANGATIALFRILPIDQNVDLPQSGTINLPLIEQGFDRLVMQISQLVEELQRRPAFDICSLSGQRGLLWPDLVADKVLGVNATGDALTYYDRDITVVTPGQPQGLIHALSQVTVPAVDNQPQLSAAAALPAGSRVRGVILEVTTAFGNTRGLTGISVGDATLIDRWGSGIALTQGTKSTVGSFLSADMPIYPSATDVVLTAEGGNFDATGQATLHIYYEQLLP